jgi:hypothetical protein
MGGMQILFVSAVAGRAIEKKLAILSHIRTLTTLGLIGINPDKGLVTKAMALGFCYLTRERMAHHITGSDQRRRVRKRQERDHEVGRLLR